MKLVIAWLALAGALGVAVSCSIKHQSEQYVCDTTADCVELGDDRVCRDGLCVASNPQDAAIDSPKRDAALPDANLCPAQCTSCNVGKKECTIDCQSNPMQCAAGMKCPTGWACDIKCNSPSSCRGGVDCLTATSCAIECSGAQSCRNLACGPGPCNVNCTGQGSCGGVSCGQSCACDVKCNQAANCFTVICSRLLCDIGKGCSSQPMGCNTCP